MDSTRRFHQPTHHVSVHFSFLFVFFFFVLDTISIKSYSRFFSKSIPIILINVLNNYHHWYYYYHHHYYHCQNCVYQFLCIFLGQYLNRPVLSMHICLIFIKLLVSMSFVGIVNIKKGYCYTYCEIPTKRFRTQGWDTTYDSLHKIYLNISDCDLILT